MFPDHSTAADAFHEEARGVDHHFVPCGRKSLCPLATACTAALPHLLGSPDLLDLLDPGAVVPGNHWLEHNVTQITNRKYRCANLLPHFSL